MGDQGKDAAKEAARKAAAERNRKMFEDPEIQKRHSKALVDKWKDPEYREKISKARREQHARRKGGHAVGHDDA